MRNSKWIWTSLVLFLGVLGCSQSVEPPTLYSPQKKIDFDGCRNTTFNPKALTPTSIRSLVSCLNGPDGAMGPVKALVDSMPDQELQVAINIFERHISNSQTRLLQVVDLLARMKERNVLPRLYKSFDILTRTESLQNLVRYLGQIHIRAKTRPEYKENTKLLKRFASEAIRSGLVDRSLLIGAQTLDSFKARSLAYLLSRDAVHHPLRWEEITIEFSKLLQSMIREKDLHRLTVLATDPAVYRAFKNLSSEDVIALQNFFDAMSKGASIGLKSHMEAFHHLTRTTDRPMLCFDNGQSARKFENLFDSCIDEESRRRKDPERLARFWLVEVPVMLSASLTKCDLDPAVLDHSRAIAELAKQGHSLGLITSIAGFYDNNRSSYIKRAIKSRHFVQAAPLVENIAARQGFEYLIDLMSRDLSIEDFQTLSELVSRFSLNNISGMDLEAWIQKRFPDPVRSSLLAVLAKLEDKSLVQLLWTLEKSNLDNEVQSLRLILAEEFSPQSAEMAFTKLLEIGTESDLQPLLIKTVVSLVDSWKQSEGGWGSLIGVLATTQGLAQEKPVQDAILELLDPQDPKTKDLIEADVEAMFDVMARLSSDPRLHDTLKYFGEMARSGDMDRFVQFITEIFRLSNEPGLTTDPRPVVYQPPTQVPNPEELDKKKPVPPVPPQGDYSECQKVNGDLFEASRMNLYHALKCFNFSKGGQGFNDLAELLLKSQLLQRVTKILSQRFMHKDYIHQVLDDMKLMYESGDLNRVLALLSLAVESPFYIHDQVDAFVNNLLSSDSADHALEGVGNLLKSSYYTSGILAGLEGLSDEVKPSYLNSISHHVLPIYNPEDLWRQARFHIPNLNKNQFDKAVFDFQHRTPDYFYRQGLYRQYSDEELKAEIVEFFKNLTRRNPDANTGDLEELVNAFVDLAQEDAEGKLDFTGFIQWATTHQRAVPYWSFENEGPTIRIVTPLDQLDILVANANIEVLPWIPFLGTSHMGILFQTEIAKSTDLRKTLDKLKSNLEMGLKAEKLLPKKDLNHLKNNRANFYVLYEMVDLGYMRVMQRLYQAFRDATPKKYKDKEDPKTNHIVMAHKHVDWGMLARVVAPVHYLGTQGVTKTFAKSLLKSAFLFKKDDYSTLRRTLEKLVNDREKGSHLRRFVDEFYRVLDEPEAFSTFKEIMFHFVLNWPRISDRTTGIVEVIDLIANEDEIAPDAISWLFDDARKLRKNSVLHKLLVNLAHLDTNNAAYLRQLGTLLLRPTPVTQTSYFLSTSDLFLTAYKRDESGFNDIWNTMKAYSDDTRVRQMDPLTLVRRMIPRYSGTRRIMADILLDPRERQDIRELLEEMSVADRKLIGQIIKTIVGLHQSGDLENLIFFLNKHAIKSGLNR